jgi:site-specific DNA-methyltransferase (adenine-specific)
MGKLAVTYRKVDDLIGGSGTTLIAGEGTGRVAYLMELDPVYVDVIIKRWQGMTGLEAVRDDGKTYNSLI